MLAEALGLVLILGGLALWLEVSFLIAAMVLGAVVRGLAKHHQHAFHEIENVERPFMVLFFVLAGASLEFNAVLNIGLIGVVYILARIVGKVVGAQLGAKCSGAAISTQRWMGFALLPQAGVAIGMALVVTSHFPEYRHTILPLVICTTVIFELLGPLCTRIAIKNASAGSDQ